MCKYRKLPVEIEAIQWNGDNYSEIYEFINSSNNDDLGKKMNKLFIKSLGELVVNRKEIIIKTLEGKMIANIGDYIIKGVAGEFYPCKPDIFEKTYEKVEG